MPRPSQDMGDWAQACPPVFERIAFLFSGNVSVRFENLRDFIAHLDREGELRRIRAAVSPRLEMTEIADRAFFGTIDGSPGR